MTAAFDRAQSNGVGDQPRFKARLDDEQTAQLPQHTHPLQRLSSERQSGSFEPFPT
jgi:hypothetical protein